METLQAPAIPVPLPPSGRLDAPTPAPIAPSLPVHGEHVRRDVIDDVLDAQAKKDRIVQVEKDMKQMQGFVRIHKCSKCGRRIKASLDGDGNAQYGTCPYCKRETFPRDSVHYAGNASTRTDRHVQLNDNRFAEGATGTGGFQPRYSMNRK